MTASHSSLISKSSPKKGGPRPGYFIRPNIFQTKDLIMGERRTAKSNGNKAKEPDEKSYIWGVEGSIC